MPASLIWLVAAWERPTARGLRRAPTVLAVVVGLTVAQPFGVIASKEDDAPRPPTPAPPNQLDPPQTNGEDVHVARLFGVVPVLPFRFYQRQIFLSGLAENTPNETLRVRSWFWLPVLTNATEVTETCSNDVFTPCWNGGQNLTVFREGGAQWATIDNSAGRGSSQPDLPDSFTWKLSAGIASPAGLVYWALAAGLVITASRRRARASSSTSAGIAPTQPPTSSS